MIDLQRVTRAQVTEHNTGSSSWICIENKVYDLTTFLDEHPGGSEVLLRVAGSDATEAYEDVGHSTDARLLKEQYLVAEIVDEEKVTYSNDKEKWFEKETDKAGNKSDSAATDPVVIIALLAVIFAIIYYFLFY